MLPKNNKYKRPMKKQEKNKTGGKDKIGKKGKQN